MDDEEKQKMGEEEKDYVLFVGCWRGRSFHNDVFSPRWKVQDPFPDVEAY